MGVKSDQAIDESARENRIVWLELREGSPVFDDLFAECEGEATSGDVREYWGELQHEDGTSSYWRVHAWVAP